MLWAVEYHIQTLEQAAKDMRHMRNSYFNKTQCEAYFTSHKLKYRKECIETSFEICNSLRKPLSADVRSRMQGDYPYFGPTGMSDKINEYRVKGEFALIGEDGDHFLKYDTWSMTQLIYGKNNVDNHAHILRGKNGNLTKWFYYYYKQHVITIL